MAVGGPAVAPVDAEAPDDEGAAAPEAEEEAAAAPPGGGPATRVLMGNTSGMSGVPGTAPVHQAGPSIGDHEAEGLPGGGEGGVCRMLCCCIPFTHLCFERWPASNTPVMPCSTGRRWRHYIHADVCMDVTAPEAEDAPELADATGVGLSSGADGPGLGEGEAVATNT